MELKLKLEHVTGNWSILSQNMYSKYLSRHLIEHLARMVRNSNNLLQIALGAI
jgi:hypothetical protein